MNNHSNAAVENQLPLPATPSEAEPLAGDEALTDANTMETDENGKTIEQNAEEEADVVPEAQEELV